MRRALLLLGLSFTLALGLPVHARAAAPAENSASAETPEPNLPLCLKTDTVKWWENAYCQVTTNVDDHAAPDFKKCQQRYRKNKAVPRTTCKKIRWLKKRTCEAWKKSLKPAEYRDCLRTKGFPQRVEDNYEYYFGG